MCFKEKHLSCYEIDNLEKCYFPFKPEEFLNKKCQQNTALRSAVFLLKEKLSPNQPQRNILKR